MMNHSFERAARLVKSIVDGKWTHEPPSWVPEERIYGTPESEESPTCTGVYEGAPTDPESVDYTRAVQTAEAFIIFFTTFSPRFDRAHFLYTCALGPKPAPKRRTS